MIKPKTKAPICWKWSELCEALADGDATIGVGSIIADGYAFRLRDSKDQSSIEWFDSRANEWFPLYGSLPKRKR